MREETEEGEVREKTEKETGQGGERCDAAEKGGDEYGMHMA